MKKLSLITFGLLIAAVSHAQEEIWETLKKQFPDEPAVFVDRSEVLTLEADGDSLRIVSDIFEDILHLKDQTDAFSGRRVYGSSFTQIEGLKAKTLVWDKSKYKEVSVSNFSKNSDRASGIFYDDSYYYTFDYPSVALRNRTQLQYREVQKDPKFLSGFVFATYLPQAKTSFVIKTSDDVELFHQVLNDPDKKIHFKKYTKGKNAIYEWTAEKLPALKAEDDSPSVRYYAPHVICYVKSYKAKNSQVRILSDLSDLYRWYYGFVKDLNKEPAAELKTIVEGLQRESKSELELVKNVYYWVQENIQYVAFEQGMRGLIPHNGSYVCEKRYGDCKDMANLIVNMLSLAKVTAYHTWIGTRDLPYKYSEVPTPLVDNHMIATYIAKDGQYYFLDATSDYTTFGYPSSMIQGKEALIGKGPDTFEVKAVPVIDREMNVMTDSMTLKIDADQLVGMGKATVKGYPKVYSGYELDRSQEDDVKKYVTRLVGKGSNKFFLDEYQVNDLANRDKPTRIDYNFRISDYFQKIGDEIYINLNLNKDHYNNLINAETRKSPKEQDYAYTKYEFIELTLPDGYIVEYLPEPSKNDSQLLGYDISYEVKGNKILFKKKLYLDYLMMQPQDFVTWNNSVKKISEAYKESIIIKKKL